jgi:predicted dehydrogenase
VVARRLQVTESNPRIKVGVIGCGQAAVRGHLPALRHVRGAEVIAVSDTDAHRLKRVADQFGIPRRYGEYAELVDDPQIDAVGVCVPTGSHLEVASAVLDAGKHLFLEKPLALTLAECDELIERAGRATSLTMLGFNMRWHRQAREARALVRRGILGPIRMIRSVFACHWASDLVLPEWRKRRELGGGALVDEGAHDFDLWRFLLDREVEEVYAVTRRDVVDDEVVAVVARMTDGILATSSIVERVSSEYVVEILGLDGRLVASLFRFDGLSFIPALHRPGDPRVRLAAVANTLKDLPRALLRPGGRNDYDGSFVAEWQHFVDSVRQGTAPECTFLDGRRSLEIVLAAAQSASLGQPVRVAEAPNALMPF